MKPVLRIRRLSARNVRFSLILLCLFRNTMNRNTKEVLIYTYIYIYIYLIQFKHSKCIVYHVLTGYGILFFVNFIVTRKEKNFTKVLPFTLISIFFGLSNSCLQMSRFREKGQIYSKRVWRLGLGQAFDWSMCSILFTKSLNLYLFKHIVHLMWRNVQDALMNMYEVTVTHNFSLHRNIPI